VTTRFWMIRHGRISANVTGHWHGSTDTPLDEVGERQVERVAAWFADAGHPISAVYTSPLQRTHGTARGIAGALGLEAMPHDDLREYGIGELEGTHYSELLGELRFFERIREDPHWAPDGGESLHAVITRMRTSLEAFAARHPGEDVVVVSHGAAMGLLYGHLLHDDPFAWRDYHVENCSISEFRLHPEPALGRFNETGHLEEA